MAVDMIHANLIVIYTEQFDRVRRLAGPAGRDTLAEGLGCHV
ncbi:hypothetical protein [Streptosporangium sp. NPDC001681]